MTELEAAKLIASGDLPSPYKFSNMTLFAVRVTGTGMAYRDSLNEYVWRDPSLYLNDEFIARVSGLPLIWSHPEQGSLNSKEFANRIIGTLMFGYIQGEDVWGVARVYDDEAIKLMTDGQLSTSPGVVFGPGDGNVTGEAPDGTPLLVEGRPSTLCHLAVCEAGVWDKGQDPTGVQNDNLPEEGPGSMADEREDTAVADKARHDATSEKLDAIMDAFKKMDSRLDSFEKEKKDKARHDAARKDKFGHRKDGEKFHDWSKRHDADEKAMCDAMRKDGADEKDCMDAAKDARKDAEEEEKRADKDFDKWAKEEEEEPEHKDSKKDAKDDAKKDAKKDSEESEEKKEMAEEKKEDRKDSAAARENAELRASLAALERVVKGITMETPAAERDALATAQSRADSVAAMFGDRASAPISGETSLDYRKRLLKRFAPHSQRFKETRFDAMDASTLTTVEDQIYADAVSNSRTSAEAAPGVLIPYEERDRAGRVITKFHGDWGAAFAPFMPSSAQIARLNRNPKGMN